MHTFDDYDAAVIDAGERSLATGLPYGVEKNKEYGRIVYYVRGLPRADKRFGVDLRCEAIEPSSAALAVAVHRARIANREVKR